MSKTFEKGSILKICVFSCSNSLNKEDMARLIDRVQGLALKTISLPCSGKIDVPYIVKAFETGADGVMVITCRQGECQNLEGNIRAQKRSQAVDSLLQEVGLGGGRIAVVQIDDGGVEQMAEEINSFCAKISNIPDLAAETSGQQCAENILLRHSPSDADMSEGKAT